MNVVYCFGIRNLKRSIHTPRSDSLNMIRTRALSMPPVFKI